MMVIEGDMTKASGILQERYGYTRKEAEKRWTEFTHRYDDVGKFVKDTESN